MQQLPVEVRRRIPDAKIPVIYSEACKLLVECRSIDDAHLWSDRADALAAWAKIYSNDTAAREAKALKLYAYRRMGEIAGELRPQKRGSKGAGRGPKSLLMEHGLNESSARAARALAVMSAETFAGMTERANPPAPTQARKNYETDPRWLRVRTSLSYLRSHCRAEDPVAIAQIVKRDGGPHREWAASTCVELVEWLDRFEHALKG